MRQVICLETHGEPVMSFRLFVEKVLTDIDAESCPRPEVMSRIKATIELGIKIASTGKLGEGGYREALECTYDDILILTDIVCNTFVNSDERKESVFDWYVDIMERYSREYDLKCLSDPFNRVAPDIPF